MPDSPKIRAHRDKAVLHAGARDRGDDLVVTRSALRGIGVQDQRPALGRAVRPIQRAVDDARQAVEGSVFSMCRHVDSVRELLGKPLRDLLRGLLVGHAQRHRAAGRVL